MMTYRGTLGLLIVVLGGIFNTALSDEATYISTPRVVVLEYSFLDAVVLAKISPVGIADDRKPTRILPIIRKHIGPYESVGLRGQPNLETIAKLRPDLIIADQVRHQAIYEELQMIAPTLLLRSYGANYHELLKEVKKISTALDREDVVEHRLINHHRLMDQYAQKLQSVIKNERVLFVVTSHSSVTAHSSQAFAGSVMKRLGINNAAPEAQSKAYMQMSLEQLAGLNPDWLMLGDYRSLQGGSDVLKRWKKHRVWQYLIAYKEQQIAHVNPNAWALGRGIYAAEKIAADLWSAVQHKQALTDQTK